VFLGLFKVNNRFNLTSIITARRGFPPRGGFLGNVGPPHRAVLAAMRVPVRA